MDYLLRLFQSTAYWSYTKRVHFKVCTLVYKASYGFALTYLSDLVVTSIVIPRHCDLWSSAHSQLIPAAYCQQFAEYAFAVGFPKLWNSLPDIFCDATSLTTFPHLLKGHLYSIAYGLIVMVITSAWIVIEKSHCGLLVL